MNRSDTISADRSAFLNAVGRGEVVGAVTVTVADAAWAWHDRGRGSNGDWTPTTRERNARVIRRQIERSGDAALPAIGALALVDVTTDMVAVWSAANERVLARTTSKFA